MRQRNEGMTVNINVSGDQAVAPGAKLMAFDGGAADYLGTQILAALVTIFTLGICYPFALVLIERWRAKHTVLMGRRLEFTGTGIGLFGLWIKWFFLIVITIGIYGFWVAPRLTNWKTENVRFA
jgi:uncharacterized membrane protein YjgN (DUF898 family)